MKVYAVVPRRENTNTHTTGVAPGGVLEGGGGGGQGVVDRLVGGDVRVARGEQRRQNAPNARDALRGHVRRELRVGEAAHLCVRCGKRGNGGAIRIYPYMRLDIREDYFRKVI